MEEGRKEGREVEQSSIRLYTAGKVEREREREREREPINPPPHSSALSRGKGEGGHQVNYPLLAYTKSLSNEERICDRIG